MVRAAVHDRDAQRAERDERKAQARDDQDLAAGLVVAEVLEVSADFADTKETQELLDLAADVEHDAELLSDSAERRVLHAEGIKSGPDQAAVDQARHPREAVKGGRPK